MLPLYGAANYSRGVSVGKSSFVVRLRSHLSSSANGPADFALVRSKEELQQAAAAHVHGVMIVGDDGLENLPEAADCPRLISVPAKFN
jgi:hypothetical protein